MNTPFPCRFVDYATIYYAKRYPWMRWRWSVGIECRRSVAETFARHGTTSGDGHVIWTAFLTWCSTCGTKSDKSFINWLKGIDTSVLSPWQQYYQRMMLDNARRERIGYNYGYDYFYERLEGMGGALTDDILSAFEALWVQYQIGLHE